VKKYPERARASLGVCPQFDVLWPSLTVREHLELFAAFRPLEGGGRGGQKEKSVDARVAASLAAVGLARDADRTAGTLSGGQRRKLSLAIAFIGEPSVVLLDEPTAGMDPVSRRHAWDVIRGLAGRRGGEGRNGGQGATDTEKETDISPVSVLLTTHFMDEADALSDRVAVVHSGKLACAGSPLFVKTAFGGGYVLRLRVSRDADLDAVKRLVHRARDEGSETTNETASFVERSGANDSRVLTFALPCTSKAVFPELLEALEGLNGEAIGVLECGVGCATLEDAFLNVADLADGIQKLPTEKKQDATKTRENASALAPPERDAVSSRTSSRKKRRKTKTATFIAQTRATFWKRAVHCRRTFMSTVASTLLAPLLFAAAGLAASSAAARRAGDPRPASMLDLSFLGTRRSASRPARGDTRSCRGRLCQQKRNPRTSSLSPETPRERSSPTASSRRSPAWTSCGTAPRTLWSWTRARTRAPLAARARPLFYPPTRSNTRSSRSSRRASRKKRVLRDGLLDGLYKPLRYDADFFVRRLRVAGRRVTGQHETARDVRVWKTLFYVNVREPFRRAWGDGHLKADPAERTAKIRVHRVNFEHGVPRAPRGDGGGARRDFPNPSSWV
jgi:ABC-type multidrug transport system ATPase subunit